MDKFNDIRIIFVKGINRITVLDQDETKRWVLNSLEDIQYIEGRFWTKRYNIKLDK